MACIVHFGMVYRSKRSNYVMYDVEPKGTRVFFIWQQLVLFESGLFTLPLWRAAFNVS